MSWVFLLVSVFFSYIAILTWTAMPKSAWPSTSGDSPEGANFARFDQPSQMNPSYISLTRWECFSSYSSRPPELQLRHYRHLANLLPIIWVHTSNRTVTWPPRAGLRSLSGDIVLVLGQHQVQLIRNVAFASGEVYSAIILSKIAQVARFQGTIISNMLSQIMQIDGWQVY